MEQTHVLDLSRPELRGVLRRYVPLPPTEEPLEPEDRTALVVGAPGSAAATDLEFELADRGWSVRRCLGPGAEACPMESKHEVCIARASMDVTAVVADGDHDIRVLVGCAAYRGRPGMVVGASDAPWSVATLMADMVDGWG